MDTKIWDGTITFEQVEKTINNYVKQEIFNIEESGFLEKWNYFSLLAIQSQDIIIVFLELVTYIDGLTLEKHEKFSYILTLVYLIIKEKLEIRGRNKNDILLLVAYVNTLPLVSIPTSFPYLNNEPLLLKVRMKSLDFDVRLKLLAYIDKTHKSLEETISFIETTEYYELLNLIES